MFEWLWRRKHRHHRARLVHPLVRIDVVQRRPQCVACGCDVEYRTDAAYCVGCDVAYMPAVADDQEVI